MDGYDDFLWDSTASAASEDLGPAGRWERAEPRAPISCETFREIVSEEMDLMPQYVFDELSGGVLVEERVRLSPDSVDDDLFLMGLYKWDGLGKQVTLFYGSFVEVYGASEEAVYRKHIRETLRHEFRHHMETRAGIFGKGSLLEEDAQRREKYLLARRQTPAGGET